MRHRIIGLLFAALIAPLLFVIASSAPANAVDGCRGQVQNRVDQWTQDVFYQVPTKIIPDYRDVRLVANTYYQYCPDIQGNKVRPWALEVCYVHQDDIAWIFDGVKFNPYWGSSTVSTDPPTFKVDDNGQVLNCGKWSIPQKWMKLSDGAAWSMTSWIVYVGLPDRNWDFKFEGRTRKPFRPTSDMSLGPWFS